MVERKISRRSTRSSSSSGALLLNAAAFRASRSVPLTEAFCGPASRCHFAPPGPRRGAGLVSDGVCRPQRHFPPLVPRRVFDGPWLEPESASPAKSKQQPSTQFIIDKILDECLRFSARKPIMRQFDPNRSMWRRWKGTVIAETWKSAARRVIWTCLVYVLLRKYPDMASSLNGSKRIWTELIAIVTFTLTFFVNEAVRIYCLSNSFLFVLLSL